MRAKLADWRGLLQRNVQEGRSVIRALLIGPLRFTPVNDDGAAATPSKARSQSIVCSRESAVAGQVMGYG